MAKVRTLNLVAPVGGVNRRFAYQSQPPFTTPDCDNVRGDGSLEGRMRIGSRPGLIRAFGEHIGSISTAGALDKAAPIWDDPYSIVIANSGVFSWHMVGGTITFAAAPNNSYTISKYVSPTQVIVSGDASGEAAKDSFTVAYNVPINLLAQVRDYNSEGGGSWEDGFEMASALSAFTAASWKDDGKPDIGVGAYEGYVHLYPENNRVDCGAVRTNALDVDTTEEYSISILLTPNGQGVGGGVVYELFARLSNTNPNVEQDGIRVYIQTTVPTSSPPYTIAWESYIDGSVDDSGSTTTTDSDGWAPGVLKLTVLSDDTLKIEWRGAEYFTGASVPSVSHKEGLGVGFGITGSPSGSGKFGFVDYFKADYTPKGGEAINRNRVFAAANGDCYRESNSGTLISVASGHVLSDDRVICCAERLSKLYIAPPRGSPRIYDTSDHTVSVLTKTAGVTAPWEGTDNLPAILAMYRDRLTWSGNPNEPQNWWMARQGTPTDYDYSLLDVQAAVAGNTSGVDCGQVAAPVTALITLSDDYLVFGAMASLYVLRGDPRHGGQIDRLSSQVGVIAPMAWCPLPDASILFLSLAGLYRLPPLLSGYAEPLSLSALPRELMNVDVANNAVALAYDPSGRGVVIAITPWQGGDGVYYWYGLETKSFWPLSFDADSQPFTLLTYDCDSPSQRGVLFGCRDGRIRRFNVRGGTDDGTAFDSYAYYGPIHLGIDPLQEGVLAKMIGLLAVGSGKVDWEIYAGNSPEEAYMKTTPAASGTWDSEGVNRTVRPRVRGQSAFIKVAGADNLPWALERISVGIEPMGEQRLL